MREQKQRDYPAITRKYAGNVVSNAIGHFDRKDNVFPVKDEHQRGNNMIDGAIALIMALARAMVADAGGSIYDNFDEPVWFDV